MCHPVWAWSLALFSNHARRRRSSNGCSTSDVFPMTFICFSSTSASASPAGSCHMNHLPRPMYISAITCPFSVASAGRTVTWRPHIWIRWGKASEILGLRVWWSVMCYVCWTVPLRNSFHLAVIDTLIRCGQRIVCLDSQSIPHERDLSVLSIGKILLGNGQARDVPTTVPKVQPLGAGAGFSTPMLSFIGWSA